MRYAATKRTSKAGTSKVSAAHRKALFVEAYLANGGNATAAAKAAGFSARTAYSAGSRLLKDVEVAGLVQARAREGLGKAKLTADEVLASLARDIRFDPAKLYNVDGSMKAIHELDEDTRLALRGMEASELTAGEKVIGHTRKVRFPEKTAARDQGMKYFGLYEVDNAQVAAALREVSSAELAAELERYVALVRSAFAGSGTGESPAPRPRPKKPR